MVDFEGNQGVVVAVVDFGNNQSIALTGLSLSAVSGNYSIV
jgi:hypothetical protein